MPLIIHTVPGDEIVPQKPALDDGDSPVSRGAVAAPLPVQAFAVDDDLPTPPAASIVEEDYGLLVSAQPSPFFFVQPFLDDDVAPPQAAPPTFVDEDGWIHPPPALAWLSRPAFADADELPFTAVAAPIADEDFWNHPQPPQAWLSPVVFSDADRLPVTVVAAPIADEDFWNHPAPTAQWTALTFTDTDVIVPQPAPGEPDEDFWALGPAHVPAAVYSQLPYLPDPEEIPAGSLVPPTPPSTRYAIFVFDD